jgi:hypothetical protein
LRRTIAEDAEKNVKKKTVEEFQLKAREGCTLILVEHKGDSRSFASLRMTI